MTFDVARLDLLLNGACKVPETSRGDRWESKGAGRSRQREIDTGTSPEK